MATGKTNGRGKVASPLLKITSTPTYEKPELCSRCRGRCCLRLPGAVLPTDLEKTRKQILSKMVAMLKPGGDWAVDWWEGDVVPDGGMCQVYYIRPATKGAKKLFDGSYGGECVFLGRKGCRLPAMQRPTECRMLEPVEAFELGSNCNSHGIGKREVAVAWREYQDLFSFIKEKLQK